VAAGGRQQRYRLLNRPVPDELVGELGAARRALRGLPARYGSQLVEAAAAEEVAVAALVHVVGWCVQTYGAEQVVGDGLVLFRAPPGGGGGPGGGAHATMEGQKRVERACRCGGVGRGGAMFVGKRDQGANELKELKEGKKNRKDFNRGCERS
jgi:hypothetical protein